MKKLLILLTFCFTVINAKATLISIDIEDKAYGINDTLTANIYISDLNNGLQQLVSAFSFDLLFQDSLLDVDQITFGDKLDVDMFFFTPSDKVITPGTNTLSLSEFSFALSDDLFAAQNGLTSFMLASINFNVKSNGLAEFSLNNASVADDFGFAHQVMRTEGKNVQLGSAVSVPEPHSIAVFLLIALFMVTTVKRRKS